MWAKFWETPQNPSKSIPILGKNSVYRIHDGNRFHRSTHQMGIFQANRGMPLTVSCSTIGEKNTTAPPLFHRHLHAFFDVPLSFARLSYRHPPPLPCALPSHVRLTPPPPAAAASVVVRIRRVFLPLHYELLSRVLPGQHGVSMKFCVRRHPPVGHGLFTYLEVGSCEPTLSALLRRISCKSLS